MKKLKAIIFDVDGTLADTEEVHRLAFNHTFAEHGLDWNWTPDLYEELLVISGGRERITRFGQHLRSRFAGEGEFDEFVVSLHKAKNPQVRRHADRRRSSFAARYRPPHQRGTRRGLGAGYCDEFR